MRVRVSVDASEARRELRRLEQKVARFNEALRRIGEEVSTIIDEAFAAQREPHGGSWAPRSQVTLDRSEGSTGRLRGSLRLVVHGPHEVSIEVRHPGAAVHQFGFPQNKAWGRGSAPIPARPFMPLRTLTDVDPQTLQRIERLLAEHFEVTTVGGGGL